jgi:hypothetical protein
MKTLANRIGITFGCLFVLVYAGWKLYTYSQTNKLYEAVLQEIYQDKSGPGSTPPRLFFVQIKGQDPAPSFINHFRAHTFAVKPGSQGIRTSDSSGNFEIDWADRSTGEKGVGVNFGRIVWLGLKPTVYAGPYLFFMKKQYGVWQVDYRGMVVVG